MDRPDSSRIHSIWFELSFQARLSKGMSTGWDRMERDDGEGKKVRSWQRRLFATIRGTRHGVLHTNQVSYNIRTKIDCLGRYD
jgi:hypothetical protein